MTLVLSGIAIHIANGGTQEIRIFDARGRHRVTAGRKGEGPSELVNLRNVFAYRDSILH